MEGFSSLIKDMTDSCNPRFSYANGELISMKDENPVLFLENLINFMESPGNSDDSLNLAITLTTSVLPHSLNIHSQICNQIPGYLLSRATSVLYSLFSYPSFKVKHHAAMSYGHYCLVRLCIDDTSQPLEELLTSVSTLTPRSDLATACLTAIKYIVSNVALTSEQANIVFCALSPLFSDSDLSLSSSALFIHIFIQILPFLPPLSTEVTPQFLAQLQQLSSIPSISDSIFLFWSEALAYQKEFLENSPFVVTAALTCIRANKSDDFILPILNFLSLLLKSVQKSEIPFEFVSSYFPELFEAIFGLISADQSTKCIEEDHWCLPTALCECASDICKVFPSQCCEYLNQLRSPASQVLIYSLLTCGNEEIQKELLGDAQALVSSSISEQSPRAQQFGLLILLEALRIMALFDFHFDVIALAFNFLASEDQCLQKVASSVLTQILLSDIQITVFESIIQTVFQLIYESNPKVQVASIKILADLVQRHPNDISSIIIGPLFETAQKIIQVGDESSAALSSLLIAMIMVSHESLADRLTDFYRIARYLLESTYPAGGVKLLGVLSYFYGQSNPDILTESLQVVLSKLTESSSLEDLQASLEAAVFIIARSNIESEAHTICATCVRLISDPSFSQQLLFYALNLLSSLFNSYPQALSDMSQGLLCSIEVGISAISGNNDGLMPGTIQATAECILPLLINRYEVQTSRVEEVAAAVIQVISKEQAISASLLASFVDILFYLLPRVTKANKDELLAQSSIQKTLDLAEKSDDKTTQSRAKSIKN